jgi:hypothetical protein
VSAASPAALDEVVAIATTGDALDVLADVLAVVAGRAHRAPVETLDRLEQLAGRTAALAEADHLYAELMRRHNALFNAPAPTERIAA